MPRRHALLPGIQQKKGAGAVGVLGQPRLPAALSEEGRLLVPRDAGETP